MPSISVEAWRKTPLGAAVWTLPKRYFSSLSYQVNGSKGVVIQG
jgi:hypothetical protein